MVGRNRLGKCESPKGMPHNIRPVRWGGAFLECEQCGKGYQEKDVIAALPQK